MDIRRADFFELSRSTARSVRVIRVIHPHEYHNIMIIIPWYSEGIPWLKLYLQLFRAMNGPWTPGFSARFCQVHSQGLAALAAIFAAGGKATTNPGFLQSIHFIGIIWPTSIGCYKAFSMYIFIWMELDVIILSYIVFICSAEFSRPKKGHRLNSQSFWASWPSRGEIFVRHQSVFLFQLYNSNYIDWWNITMSIIITILYYYHYSI